MHLALITAGLQLINLLSRHYLFVSTGGPTPTPTSTSGFLNTPPPANGDAFDKIIYLGYRVESFLLRFVVIAFMISMIIGALMRLTAFGSERRIAIANTAIAGSLVGLLIILLAPYVYQVLIGIFGNPNPIH